MTFSFAQSPFLWGLSTSYQSFFGFKDMFILLNHQNSPDERSKKLNESLQKLHLLMQGFELMTRDS